MLESKYLYDMNINEYSELPYVRVLTIKIYLTKKLLHKLIISDSMNDTHRMAEVFKAEKFNRELLKEIGYTDKDISLALKAMEEKLSI